MVLVVTWRFFSKKTKSYLPERNLPLPSWIFRYRRDVRVTKKKWSSLTSHIMYIYVTFASFHTPKRAVFCYGSWCPSVLPSVYLLANSCRRNSYTFCFIETFIGHCSLSFNSHGSLKGGINLPCMISGYTLLFEWRNDFILVHNAPCMQTFQMTVHLSVNLSVHLLAIFLVNTLESGTGFVLYLKLL